MDRKSAERIIKRALAKGWWFATWQCEGEQHIAFSGSIDLDKDLRNKLPGLKFELDNLHSIICTAVISKGDTHG